MKHVATFTATTLNAAIGQQAANATRIAIGYELIHRFYVELNDLFVYANYVAMFNAAIQ